MIENKFLHYQTKTAFENDLKDDKVLDDSVVFIKESNALWTHGKYYYTSGGGGEILTSLNSGIENGVINLGNQTITPQTNKICYNIYQKGYLVRTKVRMDVNNMFTIQILGNTYKSYLKPINTTIQFYNYDTDDVIIQPSAINLGHDLGTIKAFCYDGRVYFWFNIFNKFATVIINAIGSNNTLYQTGENLVEEVYDADIPEYGVTRLVEITPINNFLCDGGKITGETTIERPCPSNGSVASMISFKETEEDNISGGVGALFTNGKYVRNFLGWGDRPWLPDNCLSITPTELSYQGNSVYHSGNITPMKQITLSKQDLDANNLSLPLTCYTTFGEWSDMKFLNFPTTDKPAKGFSLTVIPEGEYLKQVYTEYGTNYIWIRRKTATWSEWSKIALTNSSDSNTVSRAFIVPNIDNIDNLNKPKFENNCLTFQRYTNSALNRPTTSDNANVLLNLSAGYHSGPNNGQYGYQLAFQYKGGFFFRRFNDGIPEDWLQVGFVKLISQEDYDSLKTKDQSILYCISE